MVRQQVLLPLLLLLLLLLLLISLDSVAFVSAHPDDIEALAGATVEGAARLLIHRLLLYLPLS